MENEHIDPPDNYLRKIQGNKWLCIQCGKILTGGITTLSNHWAECAGKEFMDDLKMHYAQGTLDIEKLEELQKKYNDGEKPSKAD